MRFVAAFFEPRRAVRGRGPAPQLDPHSSSNTLHHVRIGIDCRKIGDFGIGTYVRGLVQGLAALRGPETCVLFAPSSASGLPDFERVAVDVPVYSVRELPIMGAAIRRAKLDLFHSPDLMLPWTSCPTVVTLHDVIRSHFPPANPLARVYVSLMTARALRKSARVLTVTHAAKRAILETFDCEPSKIVVAPNGVDPIFRDPGPKAHDLGRYFLFAGNDKAHKNVPLLLEAFAAHHRRDPELKLVMAGAAFERYSDRPGVVTTGFVGLARLAAIYRGAIALVLPSLEEGFGLPAVEAMAAGTPVLASAIPALEEVTGGSALLFDPRSLPALEGAMTRMLQDETLRENLVSRGRARAAMFSWEACARATVDVYRSAAGHTH